MSGAAVGGRAVSTVAAMPCLCAMSVLSESNEHAVFLCISVYLYVH